MAKTKKKPANIEPKDKLLSKVSVFFFDNTILTALLWIALVLFGMVSYSTLMKREGFPSVNFPIAFVQGTYFVNDPSKVDAEVAGPISDIVKKRDEVSSVQTQSTPTFFSIQISYEEGTDARAITADIEKQVKDEGILPESAVAMFNVPYFGATGGDIEKIDMAISFFNKNDEADTKTITAKAEEYAAKLKSMNIANVEDVFVKSPYSPTINPATGEAVVVQRNFDRFGIREDNQNKFSSSVIIGVSAHEGFDVIELDEAVRHALEETSQELGQSGYEAKISASFAPDIEEQISELQRSLLEGLIAVLIIGSIVIAIRASIITVIAMVTVVAITLGFLHIIGYTLNVITLFSLILALALIVDDTIIMVEAIDASRHKHKDRRVAVREATRKVSRAMVAATLTASLSFAPLLFVSGILGNFIKAIPVTVIASLLISLFVALIFIPFFARYLLLGKKQMGKKGVVEVAAGFEAKLASFITMPMIWARHSTKKLLLVGSGAVAIGLGFIIAGLLIGLNVPFNIFPPTKDTNGLAMSIVYPPGLSIDQANQIAADADKLVGDHLGTNFVQSSYFNSGSTENANSQIDIISYRDRDVTSPELVDQLQQKFDNDFKQATVAVGQLDIGPPASSFVVQIQADDRESATKLAGDLKTFMESTELERANGTTAKFVNVSISNPNQFIRSNGEPVMTVSAGFDADDISTLVTLGEQAVNDEFTEEKLAEYGMPSDAIKLDLGFESENQESFATLALAFPILLVVMYILLAIQFKSLLQPILIFMAIPFSLFGITLGLHLTSNSFSFFAMLGFFALLGLSIKNTILLTDYANQTRQQGMGVVDSAVEALRERFRPLFATSATAVVSLIPLALTSPFWEALMVVLIFGLLSSTFLVVTVFPYYYLGAEFARQKTNTKSFLIWLITTVLVAVLVGWLLGISWVALVLLFSLVAIPLQRFYTRRLS